MSDPTTPNAYRCPVCVGAKPRHISICGACANTYGHSVEDWPEWLRFLVNDEARWLYEEQQAADLELSLDDIDELDDLDDEDGTSYVSPLDLLILRSHYTAQHPNLPDDALQIFDARSERLPPFGERA
jgi:hypothetical protein